MKISWTERILWLLAAFLTAQIILTLVARADSIYDHRRPRAPTMFRIETTRGRPLAFKETPTCVDSDVRTLLLRRLAEIDLVELTPEGVALHMSNGRRVVSAGGMRAVGSGRGFFDAQNAITFYFFVDADARRISVGIMQRGVTTCAILWAGPITEDTP